MEISERYLFDPNETVPAVQLNVLCDGKEIFPAMLEAIDRAKQRIALEIYMLEPNATGRRFLYALIVAATRGCQVRVIYDDIGSLWTPEEFFEPLKAVGGKVQIYHPVSPWRRNWSWLHRDHRKMLLVDKDWALVGGINLSNEYERPISEGGYHDLAVEVRGKASEEVWKLFEKTWSQEIELPSPVKALQSFWLRKKPVELVPLEIIENSRYQDRGKIRRSILYAISQAQKSVDIMNPYFLPDHGFVVALGRAVERGVRVRVIVPRSSDVWLVDIAFKLIQQKLMKHGIEVHVFPGMAHAKAVLVDNMWFSIGSYNFDHMSLFHNLEVVVNSTDEKNGKILEDIFEKDCQKSSRLTLENWKRLSWWKRFAAHISYRLRKFL